MLAKLVKPGRLAITDEILDLPVLASHAAIDG
jgi:hypothetical protein